MQKDIESQRRLETNTTEISAFGCEIGDGAAEILPSQVPQKRKTTVESTRKKAAEVTRGCSARCAARSSVPSAARFWRRAPKFGLTLRKEGFLS